MIVVKLEKCPFCECRDVEVNRCGEEAHKYAVFCTECGSRGARSSTKHVAMENWNKRSPIMFHSLGL